MLTPLTERQKALIVNNVVKACKDIRELNNIGYNFLCQANGFIAHYSRYGFIDYYENNNYLQDDIIRNSCHNQWTNFRKGEQNYDYYMAKADVYNHILEKLLG
jgi:hypothetical protein